MCLTWLRDPQGGCLGAKRMALLCTPSARRRRLGGRWLATDGMAVHALSTIPVKMSPLPEAMQVHARRGYDRPLAELPFLHADGGSSGHTRSYTVRDLGDSVHLRHPWDSMLWNAAQRTNIVEIDGGDGALKIHTIRKRSVQRS